MPRTQTATAPAINPAIAFGAAPTSSVSFRVANHATTQPPTAIASMSSRLNANAISRSIIAP
ncbi:TPA: hypothetical protein ACLMZU_001685 [Streptococcus pyogenes]